jgi:hypothetical protein
MIDINLVVNGQVVKRAVDDHALFGSVPVGTRIQSNLAGKDTGRGCPDRSAPSKGLRTGQGTSRVIHSWEDPRPTL